jgi:hypothetical protein
MYSKDLILHADMGFCTKNKSRSKLKNTNLSLLLGPHCWHGIPVCVQFYKSKMPQSITFRNGRDFFLSFSCTVYRYLGWCSMPTNKLNILYQFVCHSRYLSKMFRRFVKAWLNYSRGLNMGRKCSFKGTVSRAFRPSVFSSINPTQAHD